MAELDQLSEQQGSKMTSVNELVRALKRAAAMGRRGFGQSAGLTFAGYGGIVRLGGTPTELAHWTITLTSNATNYIEFDATNTASNSGVSKNTTGFTAGREPLFQVVVDVNGGITSVTEYLESAWFANPRLALSLSSDANRTLSAFECRARILDITSAVSLTATRNIVLPLVPREWIVNNATTGAQSLQFIGATGTGVTVANGKRAVLYSDGTNVVRVTSDT